MQLLALSESTSVAKSVDKQSSSQSCIVSEFVDNRRLGDWMLRRPIRTNHECLPEGGCCEHASQTTSIPLLAIFLGEKEIIL
jgi:hypothetical protein